MKVIKHKDKWYLQSETGYKEILLSTDIELQKDGVQAIDDEFLEWFVKNPSCESVEVESWKIDKEWDRVHTQFNPIYPQKTKYKIIIPKEEPKQETSFDRLVKERDELSEKLVKLEAFLSNTEKETAISGMTQYTLLIEQSQHMAAYLNVLDKRIIDLEVSSATI